MHLKFETVTKWGGLIEGANAPAIAQSICAPAAETRRTINGSLTVQLKLTFFSAFPISFRSSSYFLLNKYTLYIVGAPAPEHPPPLERSTCFAIRALCSFFISLNFLHSLKVFHFLFMPPACLLFALILRSIVRFVGPALRSAEFLYLLAGRAGDWTIWPTHSYFDSFTNGIKFRSLHTYKLWQTCDMRIITVASPRSALD